MMLKRFHQFRVCSRVSILALTTLMCRGSTLEASDYFLTIGGGYSPSGNQASLEENVVFLQQVLNEKHSAPRRHDIYFADGDDAVADLQVLATKTSKSDRPATDLLASLHRRRGQERVEYRNHRVPDILGPLDPALVHARLEAIAKSVHDGDRLIIYVTAHGSEGSKIDEYNTTIDCWNEGKITAREFTGWLNDLPPQVPVVMVMAQCYCGGFARAIFNEQDATKGLSKHLRAGFFAQQHNLPAAGCRPDIAHDQEFSSYFWGAIAGRSRNGMPIDGCDIDGNGLVSFAEAYAYAVAAGETIDIPLRTSDVLLRTYSRLSPVDEEASSAKPDIKSEAREEIDRDTKSIEKAPNENLSPSPNPSAMSGTLQSFVDRGSLVSGWIVTQLAKGLGFSLQDDVATVVTAYENHRNDVRPSGRGRGGRRGPRSGRRELLKDVGEKWPELADPRHWEDSPLLKEGNQDQLLVELKQLPSWKVYEQNQREIEESGDQSAGHELREVKFRRLIKTIEIIILDQNLPIVSTAEIVGRYRQIISLEESTLSPAGQPAK